MGDSYYGDNGMTGGRATLGEALQYMGMLRQLNKVNKPKEAAPDVVKKPSFDASNPSPSVLTQTPNMDDE